MIWAPWVTARYISGKGGCGDQYHGGASALSWSTSASIGATLIEDSEEHLFWGLISWMVDWLVGWLVGCLEVDWRMVRGCLVGWLVTGGLVRGWLEDGRRLVGWLVGYWLAGGWLEVGWRSHGCCVVAWCTARTVSSHPGHWRPNQATGAPAGRSKPLKSARMLLPPRPTCLASYPKNLRGHLGTCCLAT